MKIIIEDFRQETYEETMKFFLGITLVSILFFPPTANASSLKNLENHYQNLGNWQVGFTQTSFVEALDQKLTKKGNITIALPNQMKIDYTTAPEKSYIYNGKKLWIHQKTIDQAQEFRKPKRVLSAEALSFLGGFQNLSQHFDDVGAVKLPKIPLKFNRKKLKTLTLHPKSEDSSFIRLTLALDSKNEIREALLFNVSGNLTHYKFDKFEKQKTLDPKLFVLPKSVKVKVVKNKS